MTIRYYHDGPTWFDEADVIIEVGDPPVIDDTTWFDKYWWIVASLLGVLLMTVLYAGAKRRKMVGPLRCTSCPFFSLSLSPQTHEYNTARARAHTLTHTHSHTHTHTHIHNFNTLFLQFFR